MNSSSKPLLLFRTILLILYKPFHLFVALSDLSLYSLGPLLPECLDVRTIPPSQIESLTVHLSGECQIHQLFTFLELKDSSEWSQRNDFRYNCTDLCE